MKLIDPHVHLRDWNQSDKETMAHGFELADRCGLSAIFEMPNTDPTITTRARAEERIARGDAILAERGYRLFHGIYLGLTDDVDQVDEAVAVWKDHHPRIVGCKLYAGHSTGNMGVTASSAQLTVWRRLAERGYTGVVAVHAEREDLLHPERRNLSRPAAHTDSRPALAEICSVQTQITLAEAAGFRGTLHICHISCPETVEIIEAERGSLPFTLTGATTPHHLFLDIAEAERRAGDTDGVPLSEFNVNPPLRSSVRRQALVDHLLRGAVDWVESDHAPHTIEDKGAGASGLPGIAAFRLLTEALAEKLPPQRVRRLASEAVLETFDIDPQLIPEREESRWPEAGAGREALWAELAREYPWDPYRGVIGRDDPFHAGSSR